MHTKKDSNELTSEAVRAIVDKYLALCNTQNIDPNQASIDTWAKAVGVRKNSIIGVPRMRASDLIRIFFFNINFLHMYLFLHINITFMFIFCSTSTDI